MANHAIHARGLGIPASSAERFELLRAEGTIDSQLVERLVKMVGFRSFVVHPYSRIDIGIVESVPSRLFCRMLCIGSRGYTGDTLAHTRWTPGFFGFYAFLGFFGFFGAKEKPKKDDTDGS